MAELFEYQINRGLTEARRLATVHGAFMVMFAWREKGNDHVSLYPVGCGRKSAGILLLMRKKAYTSLVAQHLGEARVVVIVVSDNPMFPVDTVTQSIRLFTSLDQ